MFSKRLLNYILLNKTFKPNKSQIRSGYYQPFRSGDKKYEELREKKWNELSEWDKFVGGLQTLKQEFRLWGQELSNQYSLDSTWNIYSNQEIVKLWDFDQNNNHIISSLQNDNFETNDINRWRTACDSDHNEGYSSCQWTVSPTGRALFSGYTDTKLPLDGRIAHAGWAFLGCEKYRRSFFRQNHFDWEEFTHLLIRCRGDGRNYFIILNTSDDRMDFTWFDRYQYVLYTHGGPYWQWCKIPFSRFYMQHKGYAQERQLLIQKDQISQIGFLMCDQNTGPFSLEIDYVGAMRDDNWTEESAYEFYFHKENKYLNPGTT